MLMFRGGLGETIQLNVTRPADAAAHPTGVAVAPPKFNDAVWTRTRIDYAKGVLTGQWQTRIQTTQAALLAQWGAYLKEAKGGQRVSCNVNRREGFDQLLYPLGVTAALGVPFSITEIKGQSSIAREYTPDYDQRFEADFAIYATSQALLAELFGRSLATGTDLYRDLVDPSRGIAKIANDKFGSRSIRDAMISGEWTYNLPEFGLNPIPPTSDEITQPGGLKAYYARGGYLINFAATRGQVAIGKLGLRFATGYILCDGIPAPMLDRVSALPYFAFVSIGPSYTLTLKESELGLAQKSISVVAKVMGVIQSIICSNQNAMQIANGALLADACVDANGKPCTKGKPGCYCTPTPARQKDAVALGEKLVGMWCARAQTPDVPIDPGFKPPPSDLFNPPPPTDASSTVPWWLVVGIGLTTGAAIFSKR